MKDNVKMSYEELFICFSQKIESVLMKLIIACLIILIITQLLLQIPAFRLWSSEVERLEGVEISILCNKSINMI